MAEGGEDGTVLLRRWRQDVGGQLDLRVEPVEFDPAEVNHTGESRDPEPGTMSLSDLGSRLSPEW